jgi:acyl-CoA synthetase (AMP-forming)/AMP-acid ligase II
LVPLTQTNICTLAHNNRILLKLDEKDRSLNVMPLFHIHGLSMILGTLGSGGSVACTPGFYAPRFFEWMESFRPTWYSAVPTMHQAVLSHAVENLATIKKCPLRFVRSASAPLPPKTMAELEAVFEAPAIEAYGMTEASHQIASNPLPPGQRKAGSVGLAAGPEVAIMDEAGSLLPAGQVGEVVIRGESVMKCYENNPEANKNAFTNGWFRTGDQGYMDSEGYFFLTGRLKEIINRGGEKISPREVDEVLMEHPDIEQVVTFALPDPRLGEVVGTAVVLKDNASATAREIREFAAQRLADFKVPSRVVVLDEIPKGPTGKLQRIGLAETLGLEHIANEPTGARATFVAPRNPTEEKLATMWANVLGLTRVGIHDEFLYLGGDSMLATLLVSRVREAFRAELSLLSFFEEAFTVARMSEWLAKADVAEAGLAVPLVPTARDQEFPLSFAQERQWFIQGLDPANCAYNSTAVFALKVR